MTRIPTSFLITWIVTALVAIVMWLIIPGSSADRQVFELLDRWQNGSTGKITGKGSHTDPWRLRLSGASESGAEKPTTVALKDNLEGIFQSSPHSPIDMAVIFKNLQRLGTKQLACSVLLAWEKPDPIALAAMEDALLDFESVVLAAPVTRGAIMEAMPPDFRRASLPLEDLAGDTSNLPVVNRVSIPTLIHGGKNAMAGFEVIDSEPSAEHLHLIARWDDRVVFSFPVLAALQHLGLEVESLKIKLGSHLQLGEAGPSIPIDEFGRLAIETVSTAPETDMLAKELIDAEPGNAELPHLEQTTLCDLRSHADINSRDFNRLIPSSVEKLMQGQIRAKQMTYARLSSSMELPLLLVIALGLSLAGLLGRRTMGLVTLITIGGLVIAVWISFQNGLWLPGMEALIILVAASACSLIPGSQRKRTTSMPRLNRLEFEASEGDGHDEDNDETAKGENTESEEQDYALAPKE